MEAAVDNQYKTKNLSSFLKGESNEQQVQII